MLDLTEQQEQEHAQHDDDPHDPPTPGPPQHPRAQDLRQRFVQDREHQHRHKTERAMAGELQHADRMRHVEKAEQGIDDRVPEERERRHGRMQPGRHRHVLPHARRQPGVAPVPRKKRDCGAKRQRRHPQGERAPSKKLQGQIYQPPVST